MTEQLLAEIEKVKQSLVIWKQREREAADQVKMGRGYLQALERVLSMLQSNEDKKIE